MEEKELQDWINLRVGLICLLIVINVMIFSLCICLNLLITPQANKTNKPRKEVMNDLLKQHVQNQLDLLHQETNNTIHHNKEDEITTSNTLKNGLENTPTDHTKESTLPQHIPSELLSTEELETLRESQPGLVVD